METYLNPPVELWSRISERCRNDQADITAAVKQILDEVRLRGDEALREISGRIDGYVPDNFLIGDAEIARACASVPQPIKDALDVAKANISTFHRAQLPPTVDIDTMPGVRCVQRAVPIRRVGLYIPGGKAPLFSTVMMLALPAKIAGCSEIVLCTPPSRAGKVAPEILYAANLCGIDKIFAIGGAQAVAAMAYGTESVPKVCKIFGPGNRYVTTAKQIVSTDVVAIDMPAGPSEVMVMADETAVPEYVAADLLSQAEHGDDSQALLVCSSEAIAREVAREVERQTASAPRRATIEASLANSRTVIFADRQRMTEFANYYAPEHLIISMRDPWEIASGIDAAGSVFIGNYSCESAGDYASGTNHTLPTSGWAAAYSGVNIDSFMRKITYQELTREGLEALSGAIVAMAQAEGLDAHAQAVKVRLKGGGK